MFSISSLRTVVPQGTKALATRRNGTQQVITGPAALWNFAIEELEPFTEQLLEEGRTATLVARDGTEIPLTGPKLVQVSPQDNLRIHAQIKLQPYEAVVIANTRTGATRIVVGSKEYAPPANPNVEIKTQVDLAPWEMLNPFKWTGSKGDTEYKAPGALRIDKLRLQATQTYFTVDARTADGVELSVSLMLFITFTDLAKLLTNDDPLGVLYNTVMAAVLKELNATKFDAFRKKSVEIVTAIKVFQQGNAAQKPFADLGVEITQAVLKGWKPDDDNVSEILAEEATITAQAAVKEAEHANRMKEIANEGKALAADAKNNAKREEKAKAEGEATAARLIALANALEKGDIDGTTIATLLKLEVVGKAATGALTVTSEMLGLTGQS